MLIMLSERIVERCNDPASENYKKVTHMSAKTIDMYKSNFIPRKGEVIFSNDGMSYDVVNVIYQKCASRLDEENIIYAVIEITPHVNEHIYDCGGYQIKEDWPLIAELPSDHSIFDNQTYE